MSQLHQIHAEIDRRRFLKRALGAFAATSLAIPGINCGPDKKTPKLAGFSEEEYHNINAVAEVFLADSPVANFDCGKAMDEFVFGRNDALPSAFLFKELAAAPSSLLAALFLDLSFIPLVKLPLEKRRQRLVAWKDSNSRDKNLLYATYRQLCLYMLSSDQRYQDWCGYTREVHLKAYGE